VSVRFPHGKRDAACALLLVMLVVACGSDDDASPAITTAPAPPATTTTTIAPDETSTTTTTTPVTTTTVVDESQAVIDAYLAAWEAFTVAAMSPGDEVLRREVEQTRTGGNRTEAFRLLDHFVDRGWVSRENVVSPAATAVETLPEFVSDDAATIIVCDLDSNVLVEAGAAPDGSDAVVDDSVTARRLEVTLVKEDGAWRNSSGRVIQEWLGQDACGASEQD
jgi:hypothetical protein